ncbi:hypothetical protein SAMN06265375_10491 [Muriicola jejuensis]|uniref:Uncharacterized protein n=1 Tax=Muriicola jejuensis TaxID=504488 RepID=A0A6P0UCX6_9FLAO|nr:hypothetical protein [Muriicola jejuensis]NER11105.1 hypothetical protein [Muriicola jejuensis]SMP23758.1 hypothetical protein SAMN06265375_10491 [Muriicola jejuensis]
MLLKRTNIEDKLALESRKSGAQEHIIDSVYQLLKEDNAREEQIQARLGGKGNAVDNAFDFDLLETDRIYHLDQIKKICIDYRLRFLDSKYFKGEIPMEGISKIKSLEKDHGITIEGFKIIAPSKLFRLEDKDDPLLFAPIGNGYFYLIHRWGNDLHPLRKALAWPFKSIVNLTAVVLLISYLCTLMVPEGLFSKSSSQAEFWIIYFFMFKSIASVVIFYGFALGKNFNPAIWNSKYFNA